MARASRAWVDFLGILLDKHSVNTVSGQKAVEVYTPSEMYLDNHNHHGSRVIDEILQLVQCVNNQCNMKPGY